MIIGLGLEIVEVGRFERALERWGEALLERVFTEDELGYCLGKRRPAIHLAARFAAKGAFFEALGRRLPYRVVEVRRDERGRPSLGMVKERLRERGDPLEELGGRGALSLSLTLTHTDEVAMAALVIERVERG